MHVKISELGTLVNRITGYDKVEEARAAIRKSDESLQQSRSKLKSARVEFESISEQRIRQQQEINSLLHRKPQWAALELNAFSELARSEHTIEQNEQKAKYILKQSEEEVENSYTDYLNALREYYRGEQLWSEKGRIMSTYGTWSLILFNIAFVFLSVTIIEPRKREAIAQRVSDANWKSSKLLLDDIVAHNEKRFDVLETVLNLQVITNKFPVDEQPLESSTNKTKKMVKEWLPVLTFAMVTLIALCK